MDLADGLKASRGEDRKRQWSASMSDASRGTRSAVFFAACCAPSLEAFTSVVPAWSLPSSRWEPLWQFIDAPEDARDEQWVAALEVVLLTVEETIARSFTTSGTVTGRTSSSASNMQNVGRGTRMGG